MTCSGSSDCLCGCCTGISVQTPQGEYNPPGLPAITYRTGTWASFRESLLASLSSSKYPALAALKTRDTDDLTIAFLDATALVLDILTFYQERLANESYLRTATQLYSLTQLSRLIGYQPSPGVSASTYLAFTIKAATGLPANPATTAITIPAGTQAQSVPAQGQTPQAFQTSADILAKADWNALPVQTGVPWQPFAGQTSLYLAGTTTQLGPGDAILIVGDERLDNTASDAWDVCHITSVQPDAINERTLVTWAEPLGSKGGPAQANPQFFALRQRAALFGYNALLPYMLFGTKAYDNLGALLNGGDWNFGTAANSEPSDLASSSLIDLDAVYAKVSTGGWLVLLQNRTLRLHEDKTLKYGHGGHPLTRLLQFANLYHVSAVTTVNRSDYAVSAKITRVTADVPTQISNYYTGTRSTAVLTQSEVLSVAEQPFDHPLYGTHLDLEVLRPDLAGITAVAVIGKNPKLTVNFPMIDDTRGTISFVPDDDPASPVILAQGQVLTLLQPPNEVIDQYGNVPSWSSYPGTQTLSVADASGRTGQVITTLSNFTLTAPLASDPVVQEAGLISQVTLVDDDGFSHSRILLQTPLSNVYDRATASVNANVGAATGGSPVTELLGSGSAATLNQQFVLKQSPLTYVTAPTPSGSASSLQVTANGAAWTAVPTLYAQAPTAQVYTTLNLPGGITQVIFGDDVEGATLPTGTNNIQATYRVGTGSAGNVPAGAITTLVDRPVGVGGVFNPLPASGGQDAQTLAGIRGNASLSVLTLGRAVSITDYQNFAASFAGIAKASALWIPNGLYRGVFLTVASAGGVQLLPNSQTLMNLVTALQSYGNPNVAIYPASYFETTFGLNANIKYDPAYSQPAVKAAVYALLQSTYGFVNRTFGLGVTSDEIAALIQGVPGVIAVSVQPPTPLYSSQAGDIGSAAFSLLSYNTWTSQAQPPLLPRCANTHGICPYIPAPSLIALPNAAEILVLDPNPTNVTLGLMT